MTLHVSPTKRRRATRQRQATVLAHASVKAIEAMLAKRRAA
jgi:hypothetical protein